MRLTDDFFVASESPHAATALALAVLAEKADTASSGVASTVAAEVAKSPFEQTVTPEVTKPTEVKKAVNDALNAHAAAVTCVASSALAAGLFATGSLDKTVRIWDVGSAAAAEPVLLSSKALAIGQVFSLSFFPDQPHLLAAGGSGGVLALWDTAEEAGDGTPELAAGAAAAGAAEPDRALAHFFAGRRVAPASVPGHGIRARADGQPTA
jgi:hypothetical protein